MYFTIIQKKTIKTNTRSILATHPPLQAEGLRCVCMCARVHAMSAGVWCPLACSAHSLHCTVSDFAAVTPLFLLSVILLSPDGTAVSILTPGGVSRLGGSHIWGTSVIPDSFETSCAAGWGTLGPDSRQTAGCVHRGPRALGKWNLSCWFLVATSVPRDSSDDFPERCQSGFRRGEGGRSKSPASRACDPPQPQGPGRLCSAPRASRAWASQGLGRRVTSAQTKRLE